MMKRYITFTYILLFVCAANSFGQQYTIDSTLKGSVTVAVDPRIEALQKKMREHYNIIAYKSSTTARGYRLMVLTTSDRTEALQARTRLLQAFPGQQVYMSFQSPYIKLKFGDYAEKSEAENIRRQITAMKIVPGNVYLVPEIVKVKPDKSLLEDDK